MLSCARNYRSFESQSKAWLVMILSRNRTFHGTYFLIVSKVFLIKTQIFISLVLDFPKINVIPRAEYGFSLKASFCSTRISTSWDSSRLISLILQLILTIIHCSMLWILKKYLFSQTLAKFDLIPYHSHESYILSCRNNKILKFKSLHLQYQKNKKKFFDQHQIYISKLTSH